MLPRHHHDAPPGPAHPADSRVRSHGEQWWLVVATASAVFASVLSSSMLAIAYPDLRVEFEITHAVLHQRTILFFTVFAVGLPVFGAIADRVDPTRLLRRGLVLFIIASIAAATATHWGWFMAAQVGQAVADAMMVPTQMAILRRSLPASQLGRALAGFSAVLASARIMGPALGGLLLTALGWRSLPWCMAAIAVVALALLWARGPRELPARPQPQPAPLVQAAILLVALLGLQLAATEALPPIARPLAASLGVAGLLALPLWARRSREAPLVPIDLLADRIFAAGAVRTFLVFLGVNAMVQCFPSYLREVHGLDPATVGGMLILPPLLTVMLARWSGATADRAPWLTIAGGLLVSTLGIALLLAAAPGWPVWLLAATPLLAGLGSSFTGPAQNKLVMSAVPAERTGSAMGLFLMAQFFSGALTGSLVAPLLDGGHGGAATSEGFAAIVVVILAVELVAMATLAIDGLPALTLHLRQALRVTAKERT